MSEYLLELSDLDSTLIKSIEYDDETELLKISFKNNYPAPFQMFEEVPLKFFIAFSEAKSFGKFYLNTIKPHFKLSSMAEKKRPRGINKASDKPRFIDLSIDTKKIMKEWLEVGEKGGVWLNMKLRLLPDGTVDRFENLGMITQSVPKKIYEAEKNKPKEEKTSGPILGNGKELWWDNSEGGDDNKKSFDEMTPEEQEELANDLPF